MGFCKTAFKTFATVALIGGGSLIVMDQIAPGSARAAVKHARDTVKSTIDQNLSDPVKLRAATARLAAEYPDKITAARGDLDQVQREIADFARRLEESRLVVQLTDADLRRLDDVIARARQTEQARPSAVVLVSFNGQRLPVREAQAERRSIADTQNTHAALVENLERDVGYLQKQEAQLAELIAKLEAEYAEYQAKIFQLDVQIEAIARNERMIALIESRQQRIEELAGFEAHSLEQLESKVAAIQSQQRDRIERLVGSEQTRSYVDLARTLIDSEADAAPLDAAHADDTDHPADLPAIPALIEIHPDAPASGEADASDADDHAPVVAAGRGHR